MKVLAVTFEFVPFAGGIASYVHTLARGLARLGCSVRVLAPSYPGRAWDDGEQPYETVRMSVEHGGPELMRFLPGTAALVRAVRDVRPDVVVLASDLAHGIGARVCRREGIPYAVVVHGSEIRKHFPPRSLRRRMQALWLRRAYEGAGLVVCVSRFVRGLMVDAGFDPGRLAVIHNGIDDALLDGPPDDAAVAALRDRHGLEGKRVTLTIARLVARKGQEMMIRAMPEVLAAHPQARYVVAGTGQARAHLEGIADDLGVRETVVFAGRIPEEDKRAWLDLCDVYVLASHDDEERVEGLGIALLEAAARGKPLVGGRHGGVPEIVEDGVNGYLVDPTRPDELASAVGRLLDDPEKARALGAAGRRRVARDFLASRMCGESLRRLEGLVAGGV